MTKMFNFALYLSVGGLQFKAYSRVNKLKLTLFAYFLAIVKMNALCVV